MKSELYDKVMASNSKLLENVSDIDIISWLSSEDCETKSSLTSD